MGTDQGGSRQELFEETHKNAIESESDVQLKDQGNVTQTGEPIEHEEATRKQARVSFIKKEESSALAVLEKSLPDNTYVING